MDAGPRSSDLVKPMKILIIRPWPSLLDVTQHTYNIQEVGLAKALTRRGHPTDILFWTDREEKEVEIPVEGFAPIRVFYRRGKAWLKNGWFPGQEALLAQYDILQTAEYNQLYSWHLAGQYPHKTVIYHGPYYAPFNKNYNRMCWVFDALFTGRYRRLGTQFLTKSSLARDFLLQKGISAQQVTTVGVGIDAELLQDHPEAGQTELEQQMRTQKAGLKLLYIGRIEPRRDPFFLLKVLQEVRRADPAACLYLIGSGDEAYEEAFRAAIREAGLAPWVHWQKKAPQYQMKGVYQQADFFLLPTEYEIFGMVLLEAMFFRRIVFTTCNGGSDMLLRSGENGIVLPKEDPRPWAEQILALARDPARRAAMEQRAYETVIHQNTWDALAERFLQAYRKRLQGE